MSTTSGSEFQDLSSNAKEARKTRTTGITTEYIFLTEISSPPNTPSSAHAKENVRKVTSSNRQGEPSRPPMNEDGGEGGSTPQTYLNPKRVTRKANYLSYLSAIETQPHTNLIPIEHRGGPEPSHPTLRANVANLHSSPTGGTRPLSLTQKPAYQAGGPLERPKPRKETTKPSVPTDARHSRQSQSSSSHSSRGSESQRELERPSHANERTVFALPLAAGTWEHMQREVESLRKTVQELHKVTRKQSKRIEDLCIQATSHQQTLQGKDAEIVALGQKCSKYEKIVSAVESVIQCQICMELPDRPFTLAPCGHVLCLTCLQEWFKTSPGVVEDEEDDVDDILFREKTCPCCRTVVKHRPCPAFMVKNVVSTFSQENSVTRAVTNDVTASTGADEDPWKGIFPDSDDEEDDDVIFTDDEDLDEDEDVGSWWMRNPALLTASRVSSWNNHYSSGSDDGLYSDDGQPNEGGEPMDGSISESDSDVPTSYVLPRWEPPAVHIDPQEYPGASGYVLDLLRRGCTWEMSQSFNIWYSHRQGIIVSLRSLDHLYASDDSSDEEANGRESLHKVYLGWRIVLDEDDEDGETFMAGVLHDIKTRPERWRLMPRYDGQGSMDVKRLVPTGSLEEHSTTDTDVWLNAEEHDMD